MATANDDPYEMLGAELLAIMKESDNFSQQQSDDSSLQRPPAAQPRTSVPQTSPVNDPPNLQPAQNSAYVGVQRPVPEPRRQDYHHESEVGEPVGELPPSYQDAITQGNAGMLPPPEYSQYDRVMATVPKQPTAPKDVTSEIEDRIRNYEAALSNARAKQEESKARRYDRGLKMLRDLHKKAKAGHKVNEQEIPAKVPTGSVELSDQKLTDLMLFYENVYEKLYQRRDLYKNAALQLKNEGYPTMAVAYLKVSEKIDHVMAAAEAGQKVDFSSMPSLSAEMEVKESMNERQLKTLQEKQKKVRFLALQAKKQGDMEEAKRLIIIAKGIDPMIEAAKSGLPVKMANIPKLHEEEAIQVVSPPSDTAPVDAQILTGDTTEMYMKLISTLQKQIECCESLAQAFQELGYTQTANKFQEYCQNSQEDKDFMMMAHQHKDPVPKFHFELRMIPTLRITPGLKNDEAEIKIIRGSNIKPQGSSSSEEIDTFVRFQFPYPTYAPQVRQTDVVRGADTVEYRHSSKVQVNLKATSSVSAIKMSEIKFEVLYHRRLGWLRGDKSLGTASLKLADLENKQEISAVIPLREGMEETGGKLEVKVSIHHPLSGIREEMVKEKWLLVDSEFGRSVKTSPTKADEPSQSKPMSQNRQVPDTIDVLLSEAMQLKKEVGKLKAQRKVVPLVLTLTVRRKMELAAEMQKLLQDSKNKQAYMDRLESNQKIFKDLATDAVREGNEEKAKYYLKKNLLVAKEFERLSERR